MPGKKAHLITAITTSLAISFIIYNNALNTIVFTILSGLTVGLPDRIERPTNSMHRGFYHSITFCTILLISLIMAISNPLSGLIYGYTSHLMLDYAKTRHKPLI